MQPPILRGDIEFEIRDLLQESKSLLVAGEPDSDDITELIVELLDCASRAKRAGFPFSEQHLSAVAIELGRLRLDGESSPLGKTA
jgi:hypothetical protein